MKNDIKIESGSIFCIPLFMDKDDWKLKTKLSENDLENDFVFGRVIEARSSVFVEIFKKRGSAKTSPIEIVNSGIMFSRVKIFWDAIIKKRWRIIGKTENYDKYEDSNYNNLQMAYGMGDDFRLRDLATGEEKPISRNDLEKYEFSVVWSPIRLENRIIEHLKTMHEDDSSNC